VDGAVRVLVVGEAPGRVGAGTTLEGAARRVPEILRLERTNLLAEYPGRYGKGTHWPLALAKAEATYLLLEHPRRPLVLMGARVAAAFELARSDYEWLEWFPWRDRRLAVCPHPSGIVRWWNDPANVMLARKFFDALDSDRAGV
jgi:hypothetical protein